MAKGLEDTTFYVQNPLISLNEVGGDCAGPDSLLGIENFHRHNARRLHEHPHTMNASSTHDTKRGEDVRARIDVLSEVPDEWERWLKECRQLNPSESSPDANEQVLIYQTLLGVWPISRSRLHMYLIKALREAKTQTNWLRPDEQHEKQVLDFVDGVFGNERSGQFLKRFLKFQKKIAFFGAMNSLSQTLLKIASPGVPDLYQGTELWDSSLADPDNRRPVDFEFRIGKLAWLKDNDRPSELLRYWADGSIKMFLIWKALRFRRDHIDLFQRGDYIPIEVSGSQSKSIIAFARRNGEQWAVAVVPRLCSRVTRPGKPPIGAAVWGDTCLFLPSGCPMELHDIFTGKPVNSPALSTIFSDFPFSLLSSETKAA
jgi:(1->4)-alpha-D-glucan 1-alpha-D-glucosylmutase